MAIYNLSAISSASDAAGAICEMSRVSNDFLAYAFIVMIIVIPMVWLYRKGYTIYSLIPPVFFGASMISTGMWAIQCSNQSMLPGWIVIIFWTITASFTGLRVMIKE